MSRVKLFTELYTTGMKPCSFAIAIITYTEGYKRRAPFWKVCSVFAMATAFYPLSMSYLLYKTHRREELQLPY
ncbi:Transmembrane domain-containing protein [Brazilian cedratvirus IHUMI]|uniref:Transmembrane domain-containing protein n=1 Tax=Brazilian cedratvirus IHUMI TaxID=2126980 RepID=A0A2R8FDY9_9VIRU|nr:Transmembrane domain-containing protein [Brazilian cedratvirus IHUMI]